MKGVLRCLLLWCVLVLPTWAQPELLAPEQAFRPSLVQIDERTLEARFAIAPGYYLYRDRFAFAAPELPLHVQYPPGQIKQDPVFGRVETYSHTVAIRLNADRALTENTAVTLKFQGCADSGVCYPPQTAKLRPGESVAVETSSLAALFGPAAMPADEPLLTQVRPRLFSGSFMTTLGLFFLAGIGLAFTACMYPLLPIVSGIVLHGACTGGRAAVLTFSYVQGMALMYTLAGLLAAASGAYLAVILQQPWVIAGFSLFFVVMALAMFGVFSLQLPGALQSRLNDWAGRFPGGRLLPVFVMGAISALIIGPCVAPPLVAALAYLGQTGDLLLGGAALYALANGLGAPLLLVGYAGASALPRLSGWILQSVRIAFGVALLGMAIWVARPFWLARTPVPGLDFQPVSTAVQLDKALLAARGRPVFLDVYADWCVSCIEFERKVLADSGVQQQLAGFALIRADITENTTAQRELLKRYGLYGPPALLFFDQNGTLRPERMVGETDRETFVALLERVR